MSSSTRLTEANRRRLKTVSVATLTTVLFKAGLRNTWIQNARRLTSGAPRMVGEAYTLRFIPAREDLDHIGVFQDPQHPQRRAIESIPPGHVLVVDARGERRAATAGDILIARLMARGAAGFVTDGGLRDSHEIAKFPFPVYCAGAAPPLNLARHHAVDTDVPIGCGEVAVFPGDIIVGDAEGVVVIPAAIANQVAEEAARQTEFETYVEERVTAGASVVGLCPPNEETKKAFEAWQRSRPPSEN